MIPGRFADNRHDRRRAPFVTGALLALVGAVLTVGGGRLLLLGGSPYYVACGLAVAASGVLLCMGRREGLSVYGAMLLATLAWSVWEVGGSGWQLAPRLIGPLVVGLWLIAPWIRRGLTTRSQRSPIGAAGRAGLVAGAVLLAVGVGAGARAMGPRDPADPMLRTGQPSMAVSGLTTGGAAADWTDYGGDPGGAHFSKTAQITPANIRGLDVAWTFRTGVKGSLETTPIKVGQTLYLCAGDNQVIALDAETGRQRWRFDPRLDTNYSSAGACRGVTYYRVPDRVGPCAERIITATRDARLIAVNAADGRPCADFGTAGQTSLLTGMGDVRHGYYQTSSAPTIVRGKVVIGGSVKDGQYWGEPSGVVRAFDAVTGRFAWAFDMGRPGQTGEPGPGESYTRSTPNAWAPMSGDEALGLVYVPTGNATPDYYGAQRRTFDDDYSSSVLAIDAASGAVRWRFQTSRHDLWDYDVSSQPTLLDLAVGGVARKAMIVPTKRGELFVLDRESGEPILPVRDVAAPQRGAVAGERLAARQPFSVGMPSFRGPTLRERDMWGLTPLDQLWCRIAFKASRYDGPMTPPGLSPSIQYPGDIGAINWGGVAIDPARGLMFVNSARVANRGRLLPRAEADRLGLKAVSKAEGGHGFGPPFAQNGVPYGADFSPFLSPLQVPCQAPPYGLISAVDLRSQQVVWNRPLGSARDSGPLGLRSMLPFELGTPNTGGPVATEGGLVFIAAAQDRRLRAFRADTGALVWEHLLPAGAHATPMTYVSQASGRQFVVVAAGGAGALKSKRGDHIVAFALPQDRQP